MQVECSGTDSGSLAGPGRIRTRAPLCRLGAAKAKGSPVVNLHADPKPRPPSIRRFRSIPRRSPCAAEHPMQPGLCHAGTKRGRSGQHFRLTEPAWPGPFRCRRTSPAYTDPADVDACRWCPDIRKSASPLVAGGHRLQPAGTRSPSANRWKALPATATRPWARTRSHRCASMPDPYGPVPICRRQPGRSRWPTRRVTTGGHPPGTGTVCTGHWTTHPAPPRHRQDGSPESHPAGTVMILCQPG